MSIRRFLQIKNFRRDGVIALVAILLFTGNGAFAQAHDEVAGAPHGQAAAEIAKDVHAEEHGKKSEDPTEAIMEHISDSHSWHLWGETSIGLPVIMVSKKGVDIFSSSRFHHGHADYATDKYTYREVGNKIKAVNASGQVDESLSKEIYDFSLTKNVMATFLSVILLVLIFTSVAKAYSRTKGKSPKGFQSLIEPVIFFVRDEIARPNIGHKYSKFMPYLLTVFFFILLNNLLGLVPIFPGGANVTGNIAFTFIMALITMVVVNINGNKYYWGHIFKPDVPVWLYPVMIPVELLGVISRPFALMVRLFANITAGHIVILSLISLIFIFKTVMVAPVSVAFVLVMDLLELMVAFLQAFIFTLLTALFIGMAVDEHH